MDGEKIKYVIMIIGTYNIRGGGSLVKRRRIGSLLRKEKPDVMLIQETKLKELMDSYVNCMWGNKDFDFSFKGADGLSGGILTIWNSKTVTAQFSFSGKGYLGHKFTWK